MRGVKLSRALALGTKIFEGFSREWNSIESYSSPVLNALIIISVPIENTKKNNTIEIIYM